MQITRTKQVVTTTLVVAATLAAAGPTLGEEIKLTPRVDERVELLCIIFRLTGSGEFNQAVSISPYAERIAAHFGPFQNHVAVQTARQLRNQRSIRYDAVISFALHMDGTVFCNEKIPFDKAPRLDPRWRPSEARAFLAQVRDFVQQTSFAHFLSTQREFYAQSAARLGRAINSPKPLAWVDRFFAMRPSAPLFPTVGLSTGETDYWHRVTDGSGKAEIITILGARRFDQEGYPVYGPEVVPLMTREVCRAFTDGLVDEHMARLKPIAERIYKHCAVAMQRQGINDIETMLYQAFARTCVARYIAANAPSKTYDNYMYGEYDNGFEWIEPLSDLLADEYEANREQYVSFDRFMPKLVDLLEKNLDEYEAEMIRAPKIAAIDPPNGSRDVDPSLTEIKVTFDRAMNAEGYSVMGGGPTYPELTAIPHWDEEGRVLTIPVELKPNWSFQFWLNRGEFLSIRSAQGIPLRPVMVTLRTRAAP